MCYLDKNADNSAAVLAQYGYLRGPLLGRGGFSRVYRVERRDTGKSFACKISENRKLAYREAMFLKEVKHPLFPSFFHLWEQEGSVYLIMEYVPGSSLETLLSRRGKFTDKQTVKTGMELAGGLLYLHESSPGLLFRDVKPGNIVIRQDGRAKLLDFGCACRIGESHAGLAGTPGYAAIEQMESSEGLTPRCDVYGLGMTLRAMAGDRPGRKLSQVIASCTGEEIWKRLPDMRSVAAALGECGSGKRGGWKSGRGVLQPGIIVWKNVWESEQKILEF